MPSLDSTIPFVYFRAKGERALVYFLTHIFVFCSPNMLERLLCLLSIMKDSPKTLRYLKA